MRLTILLCLCGLVFAQDAPVPQTKPIAVEDLDIANALYAEVRDVQKSVNAAIAKQEARLCKEAGIERVACLVDWHAGTVGPKPKPKPEPEAPKTPDPAAAK